MDILDGLYGIREAAPGGLDILASIGLGLLLAALLGLFASMFRTRPRRDGDLAKQISAARDLPEPVRIATLAGVLKWLTDAQAPGQTDWTVRAAESLDIDKTLLHDLKSGLYTSSTRTDPDVLEQAVARAAGVRI
ncbi:MAG: hypothetical protein AB8B85_17425 [Paracoccaceae bacterium]